MWIEFFLFVLEYSMFVSQASSIMLPVAGYLFRQFSWWILLKFTAEKTLSLCVNYNEFRTQQSRTEHRRAEQSRAKQLLQWVAIAVTRPHEHEWEWNQLVIFACDSFLFFSLPLPLCLCLSQPLNSHYATHIVGASSRFGSVVHRSMVKLRVAINIWHGMLPLLLYFDIVFKCSISKCIWLNRK